MVGAPGPQEAEAAAAEERLVVAVAQTAPRLGAVAENVAAAEAIIRRLAGRAELVVFPELFTTGYSREALDHDGLAEPLPDGPTVGALGAAAREAGVAVIGTILECEGATAYDTAVVIDADGALVGRYRKSHLYPAESPLFGSGDELVVTRLRSGLQVGLAICFEHAFPEIFAELALAGADLIAVPAAVPVGYEYLLELRTRARAQDNQLFVATANLAGHDGRTAWCGGSCIVDPRGTILAAAGTGADVVIQAPLELASIDRERAQEPALRHRRPTLYRHLQAGREPSEA